MRESTLTSGCSDSPLACIIRHASYAEIAAAPCSVAVSYVRTTITRQLPLIKIASTEPVVRPPTGKSVAGFSFVFHRTIT